MRYLVGFVFLLALVASPLSVGAQAGEEAVPKVALAIHTQHRLPPQLMLRASYFLYLDTDAIHGVASETNAEEPKSAQADGEVTSPESNPEEPVFSPAPGTEVPDIDTLSQRAMERYEIQSEEKKKHERRRRRGLAIGVPIAVAVVVVMVMGAAAASSFD